MSGRGRGRGGGSIGPQARDDQGNLVLETPDGPPPLYPEIKPAVFPGKPETTERLDDLRAEHARLTRSWKNSVYNLDNANKADKVAVVAQVQRWSSNSSSAAEGPGTVAQFISLTPTYFPAELYSADQKRASSKAASDYQKNLVKSAARNVELTSEEKAEEDKWLNARLKVEADNETKANAEGRGEEQLEEDGDDEIEEEDEDDDNDDYMQGQEYDDDDGYGDDYDDAEDGDAVF